MKSTGRLWLLAVCLLCGLVCTQAQEQEKKQLPREVPSPEKAWIQRRRRQAHSTRTGESISRTLDVRYDSRQRILPAYFGITQPSYQILLPSSGTS